MYGILLHLNCFILILKSMIISGMLPGPRLALEHLAARGVCSLDIFTMIAIWISGKHAEDYEKSSISTRGGFDKAKEEENKSKRSLLLYLSQATSSLLFKCFLIYWPFFP